MKKGVIILSGYNIRAVVAFCRWALEHHIPFHLLARSEEDPIYFTRYRNNVFLIRKNDHLELKEFCGWLCLVREQFQYEKVLVLPSTEFLNRFMLQNRPSIELVGGIVPLVDQQLYEQISDKYSFGTVCMNFGIPVPETYEQLPVNLPFVAKPKSYSTVLNRQLIPYLIKSASDLENFLEKEIPCNYFFQQYIEGHSFYLLASIPRDGEPVIFSQENLMQQSSGGSMILARTCNFHKQKASSSYLELLEKLNFYGLIMIEIRFHKDMNRHIMIEANPRLWGPIQLVVDNGIDMFGSFLGDYGFDYERSARCSRQTEYYFWSGGMTDSAKPFAYHHYSAERFVDDYNVLMRNNLFFREDTIDLFRVELFRS